MLIILVSCLSRTTSQKESSGNEAENTEQTFSQETEKTGASEETEEDTSANIDLPASKYFKVDSIFNAQYLENSKFEMEFEILNNTDYKFSKFELFVQILYVMKNSNSVCESTVQYDALEPRYVENWEPHTKIRFHFITPSWGSAGGCFDAQYNRTPEKITLVLKPFPAISVDLEVEEPFAMYDLLPLWKERQVKEGLR